MSSGDDLNVSGEGLLNHGDDRVRSDSTILSQDKFDPVVDLGLLPLHLGGFGEEGVEVDDQLRSLVLGDSLSPELIVDLLEGLARLDVAISFGPDGFPVLVVSLSPGAAQASVADGVDVVTPDDIGHMSVVIDSPLLEPGLNLTVV